MQKEVRVDKYLECVVCEKKVWSPDVLPDEDQTVCENCTDIYLEGISKYLKHLDREELKKKENENLVCKNG